MIVNLKQLQALIYIITFIIDYCILVTCAGIFQAWIAYILGDDTAKRRGFLSINPLAHIDFIGMLALYLVSYGWGRMVPIKKSKFSPRLRQIKFLLATFAEPFAYFLIAIASISILVLINGSNVITISKTMFTCSQLRTHAYLVKTCPVISTGSLWISFLLIQLMLLAIIIGCCNFLVSSFRLGVSFFQSNVYEDQGILYVVYLISGFVLFNLLLTPFCMYIFNLLTIIGYKIALLIGA